MSAPRGKLAATTRRGALQAGLGLLALGAGLALPWLFAPRADTQALIARVSASLPPDPAIAALGRAHLRLSPQSGSRRMLHAILERIGFTRARARASDDDELHGRIRRRILEDYAAGEVVMLQGWVVSRTLGEIAALRALSERPVSPNSPVLGAE